MTRRYEVITELVDAIAEVEGCSAHELDYSLYDHIEPDVIKTLVVSEHGDWKLTFDVPDHTVEISGNGLIRVDDELVREPDELLSEQ